MSSKPELDEERQQQSSPDQKLWFHVLFVGLQDARAAQKRLRQSNYRSRNRLYEDQTAAYWLKTEHFAYVCELAGLDPEWIRDATDHGASIPEIPASILGKGGKSPTKPEPKAEPAEETVMVANGSGPPRKVKAEALALPGRFGVQPPEADAPDSEAA